MLFGANVCSSLARMLKSHLWTDNEKAKIPTNDTKGNFSGEVKKKKQSEAPLGSNFSLTIGDDDVG